MEILPQVTHSKTHWRRIAFTAAFFLSAVPFYPDSPFSINYTGLFDKRPVITAICLMPSLMVLTGSLFQSLKRAVNEAEAKRDTLVMLGMTLLLLSIPYHEKEDVWSGIHVLWAFLSVLQFNRLLWKSAFLNYKAWRVYTALSALAFLTALSAMSINGASELLYEAAALYYLYCASADCPDS